MTTTTRKSLWDYTTVSGVFIIVYHVGLLIGLPLYFWYRTPSLGLLVTSIVALFLTEIGIGAAYHRFYSHRAYEMNKSAESVLLTLATIATQGSVLRWSFEHRLHHAYVDTDRDPYSIQKGFWYAHCLWLFDQAQPIDESRVSDLMKNKLVMFQHRFYALLSICSNIALWLTVGWWFGDFLGAFVLTWWTRLLVSHHLTWFINSLAHYWGEKTYSKEHSAVDNFVIAFLTVGEGYHNYHHTFASDYRNGVRWYHFDPVKWTIWSLSKLGLARGLRRYNSYTIKRRLLTEDRKLLIRTLEARGPAAMRELGNRVHELSEQIQARIDRMRELADELKKAKRAQASAAAARVRAELRSLREGLRADWQTWSQLSDAILDGAPA